MKLRVLCTLFAFVTAAGCTRDFDQAHDACVAEGRCAGGTGGDAVAPTVAEVTSSAANGVYGPAAILSIQVTFSEPVTVTGVPTLKLETGANDRSAFYSAGSGTTVLTFTYTVVDGDDSSDLEYAGTDALAPGGPIKDAAGNDAVLTLPAPGGVGSLGGAKNIVIDTRPALVTAVTSPTADGAYKAGDTITVRVTFSEPVFVQGTPLLALATGVPGRSATYQSGSGTTELSFSYVVQAGDATARLDYPTVAALSAGTSIKDVAGNNATLTLPTPASPASLGGSKSITLDTTSPTVASVSSVSPNGRYKLGDVVTVQVTFSEPVIVSGVPTLTLATGGAGRAAFYSSGSGTASLSFVFTVAAGDGSADLDYVSSSSLTAGASIRDAAANDASLALPAPGASGSLGATSALVIDSGSPVVSSVSATTANGSYKAGNVITVVVTFSEPVVVTGTPTLALSTGFAGAVAAYVSGSGSANLSFEYVVRSGDNIADLDYANASALTAGTSIRDLAGNDAALTLAAPGAAGSLGSAKAITLDTTAPVVVSVTSNFPPREYKIGNPVTISVNFSEPVVVAGTPTLLLAVRSGGAAATYSGGSGTATLTFDYTVAAGDASPDLDYLSTSALSAGTSLRDVAGNDATLTLPAPGATGSLGANTAFVIDGVAPTIVSVSSATANGSYSAGAAIAIRVTFSEPVTVNGTPSLLLNTGASASYSSGTGTTVLTFNYVVAAGQNTADLDYASVSALTGGFIVDSAVNDADRQLPAPGATGSLGANAAIRVDTTAPTVTQVTSAAPNGNHSAGETLAIDVQFNEPIVLTGTATLRLAVSASGRAVTCASATANTLSCSYSVLATDSSADLDYSSSAALIAAGSIRDAAGNNANLALPAPGAAGSLGANKAIVIVPTTAWKPVGSGLYGGTVAAVAVDPLTPSTIYLGTPNKGVYKSTDSGGTWTLSAAGITTPGVYALAINPTTPSTLYAACGGGVYKSTDSANSWTQVNNGLPASPLVLSIAIDPAAPQTLYVGLNGQGVYKTTNGGTSWNSLNTGMGNPYVVALAIHPSTSSTVLAGTLGGLFKTVDGAANWSAVGSGIGGQITDVAFDPVSPSTVFVTTENTATGVYKSTDSGANFIGVSSGVIAQAQSIVFAPGSSSTLYVGASVGLYKSVNAGANWSQLSTVSLSSNSVALAVDPLDAQNVYAGLRSFGFYKSNNAGTSWSISSAGLTALGVSVLAVDPANSSRVYAGTELGVFASTNGGVSFAKLNSAAAYSASSDVTSLAFDTASSAIYAGLSGGPPIKSTDQGATWSQAGCNCYYIRGIATDKTTPGRVYFATSGWGICTSQNGGSSCTQVRNSESFSGIGIDGASSSTLYATRLNSPYTVLKSTDSGATWTSMNSGLNSNQQNTLTVDPVSAGVAYTTHSKTVDGAASWSDHGINAWSLAVDTSSPMTVYAATNVGGVMKTVNRWSTSYAVNDGLVGLQVYHVAIDPTVPSTLYAITNAGIFKTTTGGE